MKRTYEIEATPAPAMSWEKNERLILSQWTDILAVGSGPTEAAVHAFFEQHPAMVPGAFNVIDGSSGHYPRLTALISKPASAILRSSLSGLYVVVCQQRDGGARPDRDRGSR